MKLIDKLNGKTIEYNGAFYTKRNGIYGYICVDLDSVKFFYVFDNVVEVEDITSDFEIVYE